MKKAGTKTSKTPSQLIDGRIKELGDWRGEMLGRLRAVIRKAAPNVVEEWKWRGVPVWEDDGMICTGETYKAVVKLTFAKGAALPDPKKLFNSSLEGNTRRAIDFKQGDKIDEGALATLVRDAVVLNKSKVKKPASFTSGRKPSAKKPTGRKPSAKKPTGKKPSAKKPTGKKR